MTNRSVSPIPSDRHRTLALGVVTMIVVILVGVGSGRLDGVVPGALRSAVSVNAESLAFVAIVLLIVCVLESSMPIGRVLLGGLLGLGVLLTSGLGDEMGFPMAWLTLREPFVAGLLWLVYVSLPLDRRRRFWLYPALLMVVLAGELPIDGWHDGIVARWIVVYAESFGMLALAALLFDWIVPWPSDLARGPGAAVIGVWLAGLCGLVLYLVFRHPGGVDEADAAASGVIDHVDLWILRNLESCIAVIALTVWFSGRRGTKSISSLRAAPPEAVGAS